MTKQDLADNDYLSEICKNISQQVFNEFDREFSTFINDSERKILTEADVILLIVNCVTTVATNIYYTSKRYLKPGAIDYDYAKVHMINKMADLFEQIKNYTPDGTQMTLDEATINKIIKEGSAMVTFPDGTSRTVTEKDILAPKKTIDDLKRKAISELVGVNPAGLILPPNRKH